MAYFCGYRIFWLKVEKPPTSSDVLTIISQLVTLFQELESPQGIAGESATLGCLFRSVFFLTTYGPCFLSYKNSYSCRILPYIPAVMYPLKLPISLPLLILTLGILTQK